MYDLKSKLSQCTISLKARVASMGTEPESRSARSDLVYRANTSCRSFRTIPESREANAVKS